MAVALSYTEAGRAVGDTYGNREIAHVYDSIAGRYGWIPSGTASTGIDHEVPLATGQPLVIGGDIVNKLAHNGTFLPPVDPVVDQILYFSLAAGASATPDTIGLVTNTGTLPKLYAYRLVSTAPNVWLEYESGVPEVLPIVYPNDGDSPQVGKESLYFIGDSIGAPPTAVLGTEYAIGISSAARGDTAALKDAAKVTIKHWRAADYGNGPVWNETISTEGLRGSPVADLAELVALTARDFELRQQLDTGFDYIFKKGATGGYAADNLGTGFWTESLQTVGEIASDRIGSVIQMSPLDEFGVAITDDGWVAKGIFPWTSGYRAVGAALANPKFSAMHPYMVDGNDLVGPANADGSIFRNLGDLAEAFGVWQDHKTGRPTQSNFTTNNDTHNHTFSTYGGAFANSGAHQHTLAQQYNFGGDRATSSDTHSHSITGGGDDETIAANYAVKYGLILDSYATRLVINSVAATVSQDDLLTSVSGTEVLSTDALKKVVDRLSLTPGDYSGSATTYLTLPTTIVGSNPPQVVDAGDWARLSQDDVGTGSVLAPQYPAGSYRFNGAIFQFEDPATEYIDRIPLLGQVAGQLAYPSGSPNQNGLTIKHQITGAKRRYLYEPADFNGDGTPFTIDAVFNALQWQRVGVLELEAEDFNILHLAGTTANGTDAKATTWAMTFLDITSGTATFPAIHVDGDALQVDVGGLAVFDTGDGNGSIGRALAKGDIYESVNGTWAKRITGPTTARRFKDVWQAYTIPTGQGTSIAADDTSFASLQGTVPAKFNIGPGGALSEVDFQLGVNTYDGNVYIRKQSHIVFIRVTWNATEFAYLGLHPNGEVQRLVPLTGRGNATILINGVTLLDGANQLTGGLGHANNLAANSVSGGSEWALPITASPDGGSTENIVLSASTFDVGGGGVAGPLEIAFDIDNLSGNHVESDRYDVTINGLLYSSDPAGYSGHLGANDVQNTHYAIDVPLGNIIDQVVVNSGGATAVRIPDTLNRIAVKTAGAPTDITVTFKSDAWSVHGAADGLVLTGKKILKPELITLKDSTGTPPPLNGETLAFSTEGGVTWNDLGIAGLMFQTEGNGPTSIPTLNSVDGNRSDVLNMQYQSTGDQWIPLFGIQRYGEA